MPIQRYVTLHDNGPALWPDMRSAAVVEAMKAEQPFDIWRSTFQGIPTPPGGSIFDPEWFDAADRRYDPSDRTVFNRSIARYLSLDTAGSENDSAAFTALTVGELLPDYRLLIREVWRERLTFPRLEATAREMIQFWSFDDRFHGVVIENKDTGKSLIQTLHASAPDQIRRKVFSYTPSVSKERRAAQAAVWCRNGMILLPTPSDAALWLPVFEQELFNFPGSAFKDQVDSFSQLILFLEHYLRRGFRLRAGERV